MMNISLSNLKFCSKIPEARRVTQERGVLNSVSKLPKHCALASGNPGKTYRCLTSQMTSWGWMQGGERREGG